MDVSDLFYPGNPAKREQVIAKMQRIYILIKQNFKATDELITFLNERISPSPNIAGISVDDNATFGKNAQTLIDKMKEIQGYVDKVDEDLSSQLDPEVYNKLTDSTTDFNAKLDFFKTLKTTITVTETVLTIGAYLVVSTVAASTEFVEIVAGASEILLASYSGVVAGRFVPGAAIAIDSIISAIVGAVERDKLNDMIDELDGVLDKFEEPSTEYTQNVFEVLGVLKYLLQKI